MTVLTEGKHPFEFLVSEANGTRSREEVTILDGEDLEPGRVLGQVTASGKYVALAPGAADGSEVAAGILCYATHADGADAQAVIIAREAEVNEEELGWGTMTSGQITTAKGELADLGIICRQGYTP